MLFRRDYSDWNISQKSSTGYFIVCKQWEIYSISFLSLEYLSIR